MTKEETKKAVEVMQAYVDGKAIQFKSKNSEHWLGLSPYDPSWSFSEYDYRIKPEAKVRPYTFEEMCEAVKKHGGYIRLVNTSAVYSIYYFDEHKINFGRSDDGEDYEFICRNFVWLDNTPCGVVEEE